jgi:2-(1,2-epoxy-1,2-dihydrophenyl)acetyl-CoA isomerase
VTFAIWRTEQTVILERDGAVARLVLNRPEALNAIDARGFKEIPALLAEVNVDRDIRVLIITGKGRGFCSGADLKDVVAPRLEQKPSFRVPEPIGGEAMMLRDVQIPVIAAVNGPAAGLGFGLALMCDFRIASERAKFVEAHVAAGLAPSVAAWYLPRIVGPTKAAELVILGDPIGAAEALEFGLVNRVVPHEELDEAAYQLALRLAALPPVAVIAAKVALQRSLSGSLDSIREFGAVMNRVTRETRGT